ncbi:MAG: hypothetical protein BWK73_25575 [Thiothrix lacustris]|uniref:Rha family transcriptional regulator n=1 Tax=Thiothrix lacustris TaxID=525917 RepID=A0A1Y1QLI2_9GAMM|nr:MAG: hypothetical protein BWK73_25575 [Thiothrix lacustris]
MNAQMIIEKLGGTTATAKLLGIRPPSVTEWRKKNVVPALRIFQLRVLRPDLFGDQGTATPLVVETPAVGDERVGDGDGR